MTGIRPQAALVALVLLSSIAPPPSGPMAAEHVVRIVSDYDNLRMAFEPDMLRIEPGDEVVWINQSDEEHDVVSFPDGYPKGAEPLQSPVMSRAGERFSHRFSVPGTYDYHCMPHLPMGMEGVIIVGRPSSHHDVHQPSAAEKQSYRDLMLTWFDDEEADFWIARRQGQGWHRHGQSDHGRPDQG